MSLGRDIVREALLLTPEVVNKPNYNFSQTTYNKLAAIYSNIIFITCVMRISRGDETPDFRNICDLLLADDNYYFYENCHSRVMGRIIAKYGEPHDRGKATYYREICNKSMKKTYIDMYSLVESFSKNDEDDYVDNVVLNNPGKEIFEMIVKRERLEKERVVLEDEIKLLREENAKKKSYLDELEANLGEIKANESSEVTHSVTPSTKKSKNNSFLTSLWNKLKGKSA